MGQFCKSVRNAVLGILLTPVWLPLILLIVMLVGILYMSGYGER